MLEYINKNRPSTTEKCVYDLEAFVRQWEKNITSYLQSQVQILAAKASAFWKEECSFNNQYEDRSILQSIGRANQEVELTFKVPLLVLEKTSLSIPADFMEDLCSTIDISFREQPDDYDVNGNLLLEHLKDRITEKLEEFCRTKAERLLLILNEGVTTRTGKKWVKNGNYKKKTIVWIYPFEGDVYELVLRVKIPRLRKKESGKSFTFKCMLFSPYSPYLIPQVLDFISRSLNGEEEGSVDQQLNGRGVSRYRYNKWMEELDQWSKNDLKSGVAATSREESVRSFLSKKDKGNFGDFHWAHLSTATGRTFGFGINEYVT